MSAVAVKAFGPELIDDFNRVHCRERGSGWCYCVAWWVPTWDGWGERTAEDNRALRQALCQKGEYDGYLLYRDGVPVGWCQAGPRDRLSKLVAQFGLAAEPAAWAITCFFIVPEHRGQGLARELLNRVVGDIHRRGATRIEAFPKRGSDLDTLDLWNGPEAMFLATGFEVVKDDPTRPILALTL